jgi:hypothetical protein
MVVTEGRFEGSRAYEVASRVLGVRTTLRVRSFVLGTGVVEVLPENPRRLGWTVSNRGGYYIELSHDRALLPGGGLLLTGEGGSASMVVTEDGETVGYAVYGVAVGSPSTIYVMEVVGL